MAVSETALLSLLFEEGRELENIKFFPGSECESPDDLFVAAHEMIRASLDGRSVSQVPGEGLKQFSVEEFVARL